MGKNDEQTPEEENADNSSEESVSEDSDVEEQSPDQEGENAEPSDGEAADEDSDAAETEEEEDAADEEAEEAASDEEEDEEEAEEAASDDEEDEVDASDDEEAEEAASDDEEAEEAASDEEEDEEEAEVDEEDEEEETEKAAADEDEEEEEETDDGDEEIVTAGEDGDAVVPPAAADESHPEGLKGFAAFFDVPDELTIAASHTRESQYEDFEAYSPFPIHEMDEAMGLGRSWIPWVTFGAGAAGFLTANALQFGTMTFDWPMIIGGKPYAPWPAFVPIMFELTVLLAGCITALVMLIAAGCFRKPFIIDPEITKDRFALWISADDDAFDPDEVREFMESLDPVEIRPITKGA